MSDQKEEDLKLIKPSFKNLNYSSQNIEQELVEQEKKANTKLIRTTITNSNQKLQPIKPRIILQQQQNGTTTHNPTKQITAPVLLKPGEFKKKETKKPLQQSDAIIVTTQDIINTKKKLSANFILKAANVNEIDDVENLELQNQQIFVFEPEFKLPKLKVLNLQNNIIINVIGLSQFLTLKVLTLDNNQITDINQLSQLINLEVLTANNNKINSIKHLKNLKNLKILSIQKNNIADFDETLLALQEMIQLQQLELLENPCTKRFSYKYDILWALRLTHLDGETVKEKDYEMSKAFYLQKSKDNIKSIELEKIQQQRPTTAMGRSTVIQQKQFNQIQQQQQQSLKFQELEIQIQSQQNEIEQLNKQTESLMAENEQLVEENENNYQIIDEKDLLIQDLEKELDNFKYEAQFSKKLQKENLELRHKIAAYEQTLMLKDCPENELKQHIYSLNRTVEEQESQIKNLKKELELLQKSQGKK